MLKHFQSNSYLFGGNAAYIEELYETYLDNPASVAEYWRDYFDALQNIYAANRARADHRILRAARETSCAAGARRRVGNRAQTGSCSNADWRLPYSGRALGESRSAQTSGTSGDSRSGPRVLRFNRSGYGTELSCSQSVFWR